MLQLGLSSFILIIFQSFLSWSIMHLWSRKIPSKFTQIHFNAMGLSGESRFGSIQNIRKIHSYIETISWRYLHILNVYFECRPGARMSAKIRGLVLNLAKLLRLSLWLRVGIFNFPGCNYQIQPWHTAAHYWGQGDPQIEYSEEGRKTLFWKCSMRWWMMNENCFIGVSSKKN